MNLPSRILNKIPEKLWLVLACCLLPIALLCGWLEREVGEKWMQAKGILRPKQVTPKKRFSLYGFLALLAVWVFVAWFVVELVEGYQ